MKIKHHAQRSPGSKPPAERSGDRPGAQTIQALSQLAAPDRPPWGSSGIRRRMKIAPVAEVKAHFSEYVKACENGPVVVTRNGRPAVVMIAAGESDEELERWTSGSKTPSRRFSGEPSPWATCGASASSSARNGI